MTDPRRRSPLAHRAPIADPDGTYALAEKPFLGKLILRLDRAAGGAAAAAVLGADLPAASRSAVAGGTTVLWLGPDEWMLVTEAERALAGRLAAGLAGVPHQIAAVGDHYTTIAVCGDNAREALARLTTLDLHPRAFRCGEVRGSMFAKTAAVLHMTGEGPDGFDLHVRASMADYLWCLLARAGREFAIPQQRPRGGERLVI